MGMFDYVTFPGDASGGTHYQSKDGPCWMETIQRDALDENGAYVINRYYGSEDGGWVDYYRGPGGWVRVVAGDQDDE